MEDFRTEAEDVHRRWMRAMAEGDFEEAWRQTDRLEIPRRHAAKNGQPVPPGCLRWDGTPLRDQHVLVRCLHGLGDTIQFARFLPEVKRTAASLVTLAQPALLPLLQTAPELGPVLNGWTDDPAPPHDVEIEIMELPYIFRITKNDLPLKMPYLNAGRISSVASFRGLSGPSNSLRVGLVWECSEFEKSRSMPLAALAPLAQIPGLELYSLQQGLSDDQENAFACGFKLQPLSRQTGAIIDAAAAILQLDLVIAVDTMIVHLAGALGRPVWLLLKHRPDWRWQDSGCRSPWYPSVRIFRQPAAGDWDSVGKAVAEELEQLGVVSRETVDGCRSPAMVAETNP